MIESQTTTTSNSSQRLFIVLGILWLALGGIIFWQLPSAVSNIRVKWETETETDTAGFNIYRADAPEGARSDDDCSPVPDSAYVQVNDELINSSGSAVTGDSYEWEDSTAQGDTRYCYQLEDVELGGQTERHTAIFGRAPRQFDRILYIILAPLSLVVGTALIISGIKGG